MSRRRHRKLEFEESSRGLILWKLMLPALGIFALLANASPALAAAPFVSETVDNAGFVGAHNSLALDAEGNPHISYTDSDFSDLKYAAKNDGMWTLETVDPGGIVGFYTSLALDAQGNPSISYFDAGNNDLKYAENNDGTWTLETVDAGGLVGEFTSLALDSQGNPHISYYDLNNGNLKYATKNGGVWTLETVDNGVLEGTFTSIALDASDNPRISYHDGNIFDLRYAAKNGGVWATTTVDAANVVVGQHTSLALDAQGNPRISYWDGTNFDLKYAARNGVIWTLETVDDVGVVGQYTSLALDAQGNPRISYYDNTNDDLKYAAKNLGTWTLITVDAGGFVGEYTSLALDGEGNPHISYHDGTNTSLKYTDSSLQLIFPNGGVTWSVGAFRSVAWRAAGPVSISLSLDGGKTFEPLIDSSEMVPGFGTFELQVPHSPTRFAKIRIERLNPPSTAYSDSFFTIEADIALLGLKAVPPGQGLTGALVSWETDPGPADLAGYRLVKAVGSGDWSTLVPLTRETSYHDTQAGVGSRYRLFGVNGFGQELMLGETQFLPFAPLAAWPLPYRGGVLQISFAVASGRGGGPGSAEAVLYDARGRLVRTIASGTYPAGIETARWDGLDNNGRHVSPGLYFLRVRSGGEESQLKVVVME